MQHYVKKLGRKNYWRKSRSVRVFSKNCASNFFRSGGKEWQIILNYFFESPYNPHHAVGASTITLAMPGK